MARVSYGNKAEMALVRELRGMGIEPQKRGWPDFWFINDEGEFCVVEVKSSSIQPLKRHQVAAMNELTKLGVKCYVYRYLKNPRKRNKVERWELTKDVEEGLASLNAGPDRGYGKATYRR